MIRGEEGVKGMYSMFAAKRGNRYPSAEGYGVRQVLPRIGQVQAHWSAVLIIQGELIQMKQDTQMTRRAAGLLLLASLAACGGGDGDGSAGNTGGGGGGGSGGGGNGGGSGGGGGGGGNGNGGGGNSVTGSYSLKPAATSFNQMLADANAMGATGFALLSELVAGNGQSSDFYVSDTAHAGQKLQYQLLPVVATLPEFLTQLNQQGSNGYMFKSFAALGNPGEMRNVLVKNASRSETFSYEATSSTGQTAQAFQADLNARGARGFRWIGPAMVGSSMVNLYAKRSDGSTYEYMVEAELDETLANMKTHWNSKGVNGWLARGSQGLGSASVDMYEKSSAQSGAVEYRVEPQTAGMSPADMKDQMNANAADGFFFFSEIVDSAGAVGVISIKNGGLLVHPLAGVSFP